MKVKFILPALTEATSPFFRPVKYSLFPPLGMATLAGYLSPDDEAEICDEHIEKLRLDDHPDLVVIQCYITSANRAFAIADHYRAKGVPVAMGGLYPTARPDLAALHADYVFTGPAEESWPRFLFNFQNTRQPQFHASRIRSLSGIPMPRRDLYRRHQYLAPNTLTASRGCPHHCDFCYKDGFYQGGRSYYQAQISHVLEEVDSMPGRHLFFLDDNLFADRNYAIRLFEALKPRQRVWQGAGTIRGIMDDRLLDAAAESGLKSLFVGFETLSQENLKNCSKPHNLDTDYAAAIRRLHERGIMVNASFVFGMDTDDPGVFDRTVDWAVAQGIETATFHILTPYPGTALHTRMTAEGRIITHDTELYDTRHAVYLPALMSPDQLQEGYHRAYSRFYQWGNIFKAAFTKPDTLAQLRHLAYSGGWKKFEFLWAPVVRMGLISHARPLLEAILSGGRKTRQTLPLPEVCHAEKNH